ncbi:THUMP domain-containing protein [Lindgomyces ingoldianus]|uniref:THUMP domain-containing protein n=1 Tax=Lindgomyces ingoldianus TaxID=673940 RepID=A0ACB6QTR6_9PLEO|nr:THUMP domain-containing protein [Lindgomyces ingoldianus]KAF2470419.1 THUMP domain-containing protein [Lindgomyces ingoldianus]
MDTSPKKRKADPEPRHDARSKRVKGKKQWTMPRKEAADARGIQPGDVGIWATCAMNKEAKSVADLRDLFQEYASKLYGDSQAGKAAENGDTDEDEGDIEAEIKKELDCIRKPSADPLFTSVKMSTQCLMFFKTRHPVEPVSFVRSICHDAADGVEQTRCRFVKRLTPITAIDRASEKGLDDVAQQVLAPHFHGPDQVGRKFAIRTSIRNNKEFTRDNVIKRVAVAVGPGHKVDLKSYDLLILVEIYQNICGMSVVGSDFDKLKRYNLAELNDPAEDASEGGAKSK